MYRSRSNEQGFTHYALLLLMVLLVASFAYIGAKRIISSQADTLGDFSYVATHPQANLQPTVMGKKILTLKSYNGKLYAGYGDYGANTGPINVTPFDPLTNAFAANPSIIDGTEQIALYRVLNSRLYAASIDPDAVTPSYFANGDAAGSWSQLLTNKAGAPPMDHVFDMNTLNGTDLWLAGSKGNDAVIYRSTDGGNTWTKSYDLAVADRAERFYAIGSFNGKLYVQASSTDLANTISYPIEATSHVFDGTNWVTGPSLGVAYYFWQPETFAGRMVYSNNCICNGGGYGSTYSMSTSNVVTKLAVPVGLYNYTIDGTTFYGIGADGTVYSTTDLTNWYIQRTGISTGRSIAVLNGQIYVGTSDSKIYKASVNPSPSLVSGTTGGTTGGTTTKTHGNGGGNGGHKK
jgi:hypothetical protein